MTTTATLRYLYDRLRGWCHAAAPLVQAARAVPGLALALRNYVMPHEQQWQASLNDGGGASPVCGPDGCVL